MDIYSPFFIIFGIILGLSFKMGCLKRNCLIMRAPPIKEIEESVYKFKDKCYTFNSTDTKCNKNPIKE